MEFPPRRDSPLTNSPADALDKPLSSLQLLLHIGTGRNTRHIGAEKRLRRGREDEAYKWLDLAAAARGSGPKQDFSYRIRDSATPSIQCE
jgi:hypothetical protein